MRQPAGSAGGGEAMIPPDRTPVRVVPDRFDGIAVTPGPAPRPQPQSFHCQSAAYDSSRVFVKIERVMFAPVKFTPLRSIPVRSALIMSALIRTAPGPIREPFTMRQPG